MRTQPGPVPDDPPVLVVTGDQRLAEDAARLAAAVGVQVQVAADVGAAAARRWTEVPLLLLGADAARAGTPVRRPAVVLLDRAEADPGCWRLAVEVGAEAVARLPGDDGWLLDRIASAAEPAGPPGRIVGVVGGRGGAGASTLVAGLAAAAAGRRLDVLVVDADPVGGGIDLLLGAEHEPGLRWADLREVRGALRGTVLADGVPQASGVRVLSCERGRPVAIPAPAMEAVLDAARRAHRLVVVDLPRHDDPATVAALWRLDVLVVVVPAEVRAAAAAAGLVERVSGHVADVRLVVRGPAPGGLSAEVVAEAVGLPLADRWPEEPRLAEQTDRGEPPGRRSRSPLARLSARLLPQLLVSAAAP